MAELKVNRFKKEDIIKGLVWAVRVEYWKEAVRVEYWK